MKIKGRVGLKGRRPLTTRTGGIVSPRKLSGQLRKARGSNFAWVTPKHSANSRYEGEAQEGVGGRVRTAATWLQGDHGTGSMWTPRRK